MASDRPSNPANCISFEGYPSPEALVVGFWRGAACHMQSPTWRGDLIDTLLTPRFEVAKGKERTPASSRKMGTSPWGAPRANSRAL